MCLLGDQRYILRKSTGNGITVRILQFIEALQHTSGTNQEKGHSASLLSHVQPEQAGLDKQFLESKILSTCLTYVGALNNCLIEMVLLSTHNKYYDTEIRKLILCYAVLTNCLNTGHIGRIFCLFV